MTNQEFINKTAQILRHRVSDEDKLKAIADLLLDYGSEYQEMCELAYNRGYDEGFNCGYYDA